jgi:DNA-binding winged helix-turn-helix (wHTH) protein/TolB-like protein/Tfp pilus assembly protein PilF
MGHRNYIDYEFGEFRLIAEDGTLWCGSERIAITQKAVELLTLLLENRGRVVSREEILERLWLDTFVDENNLSVTVSMLRKAFGEKADNPKLIETIPRKGYRFIGDVKISTNDLVVAEREYTRAVIEHIEIDDENAGLAIAQLQKRTRLQRLALVFVAFGILLLAGLIGGTYLKGMGPFSAPAVYSVAVMPLKDLSSDENGRQMSYGLTDSLITKLSAIRGLSVRPMSAVMPLAEKELPATAIGQELKVDAVLEGTIQRGGDKYRVSVQIVNARDNQVLWANVIEQRLTEPFDLQRLLAAQVANAIAFRISDEDRKRLSRQPTRNAEAYSEHLLARFFLNKRTVEDLNKALPHFERSIELDPAFAEPYAGIASAYMLLSDSGFAGIPPDQGYPKAKTFAAKALELDETIAEAHAVLGNVELAYAWNVVEGERQLRRAIELNPSLSTAHLWLGWNLIVQQRFFEADEAIARAAELDPTSMVIAADLGYPAFFSGDYDRATERFRIALERDRNFSAARFNIWRSLFYGGRYDEASAELDNLESLVPKDLPVLIMARGCTLARQGRSAEAKGLYDSLRERQRSGEFITPNLTATLAAELDDKDGFFRDLETFLSERIDYTLYIKFAPEFKQYHADPRFQSILERAGLGG